jgi:predicted permease
MSRGPGWWQRVINGWRGPALERGLDDEVRFHLEQQIAKNIRSGMTPEAARRAAYVKFGGVEPTKERVRDEVRPAVIQDFWRDMRIGARRLFRAPAFAAVAILTLGLGTGAATAVFSVVNDVLLRPLPYPEPDRLVRLYQIDGNGRRSRNVSGPNVDDWQVLTHGFASIARMSFWGPVPVVGGNEPTLANASMVSREFFEMIGGQPSMGRAFATNELKVGGPAVAIVSRSLWRRVLDASPDFGRTPLRIGGGTYTVVGVMPEGFDFPNGTAIWLPRESQPPDQARTAHNFQVVARLGKDVTVDAAIVDLSRVSRDLKARYGDSTWMADATAVPLLTEMTATSAPALRMLFGAALVLLIIATTNVSSLLLARAASRRQEFAVQLAIGASRARIMRQLLAETLVLCLAGGLVGAVTAFWAVPALIALGPSTTPRLAGAHVDWLALVFALGISTGVSLVLGLLTALGAREAQLSSALSDTTRGGTLGRRGLAVRRLLVVVQVAATLVLLAGAGLLAQSFMRLMQVDPGFRLDDTLVLDVPITDGGSDYRVRRVAQVDALLERLRALPGVTHVGMTSGFPLGGGSYSTGQFLEMTSADELRSPEDIARLGATAKARAGNAGYRIASGGYFASMGIPLLQGRVFTDGDAPDAPHVAVISRSLAESRWPGRDPIGRFIQFGNMDGDRRGFQVVGVVGDVREQSLEAPIQGIVYASYRQRPNPIWRVSLIVRGPRPDAIAPSVRRIVREVNPELPLQIRTIDQAFNATLSSRRFSLVLIGVFGGAALLLAVCGLYALIAYIVAQRTREIGIRMALGATTGTLVAMVVRSGALLAIAGCAVGLVAAILLGSVVQGMLFGTAPTDPVVLAIVVAVTFGASITATLIPARRATRVSPVVSLRAS